MRFDIGDVLSVTTGRLCSRDHVAGLYRILNFMTGDELWTHQLPRAQDECRPALLAQFPELADVDVSDMGHGKDEVYAWLDCQAERFGGSFDVQPLRPEDHTHIGPRDELLMRGVPPERIVVL